MILRTLTLVLIFSLVQCSVATAQEKSSWWNPFSSKGTSAASASSVGSAGSTTRESSQFGGGSNLKWPEFQFPSWSAKVEAASKPKGPSTLSRMGTTSKRWWNNTVYFINPFDSKPTPKTQGYQPQIKSESKSGSGPFGWMWREEKTEAPTNVNDFLKQPRPGFPSNS